MIHSLIFKGKIIWTVDHLNFLFHLWQGWPETCYIVQVGLKGWCFYSFILKYISVFICLHVFTCTMYMQCLQRPENSIRIHGTGINRQLWSFIWVLGTKWSSRCFQPPSQLSSAWSQILDLLSPFPESKIYRTQHQIHSFFYDEIM